MWFGYVIGAGLMIVCGISTLIAFQDLRNSSGFAEVAGSVLGFCIGWAIVALTYCATTLAEIREALKKPPVPQQTPPAAPTPTVS